MKTDPEELNEIAQMIRDYYAVPGNEAGGSLHVVLDDDNTDTGCVLFCQEWAEDHGDEAGVNLASRLLKLTEEERDEVIQMAD